MPDLGLVASDSLVRNLSAAEADPFLDHVHLTHLGDDDVRVVSAHDQRCFGGIDQDLYFRHRTRWENAAGSAKNPSVAFLNLPRADAFNGAHPFRPASALAADRNARRPDAACNASRPYTAANVLEELGAGLDEVGEEAWRRRCLARPSVVRRSTELDLTCGRDHKWRLVQAAVDRRECDCLTQTVVTMAVYRFWRCKAGGVDTEGAFWYDAPGGLDNLGIGAIDPMGSDYTLATARV